MIIAVLTMLTNAMPKLPSSLNPLLVVRDTFVADCVNIFIFSLGLFLSVYFLNRYRKERTKDVLKIINDGSDDPDNIEDGDED